MAKNRTRFGIVIILLAIAAGITMALNMTATATSASAALEELPLDIGDFVGTELPVEQSVKDILETPNVLMRDYANDEGVHIFLSIVYYQQYRVYFHMPEGCMTGRGSVIVATETETLKPVEDAFAPVTANKFLLEQKDGFEHVLYFFVAGDLITSSYSKMRLHLMMEHLRRRPTGAALVRLSIRTSERDAENRLEALKNFTTQMLPLFAAHLG